MTTVLSCMAIEKLLHPYLDGELSPDERVVIEHHVAGCMACRRAFVALERTALAIEALPRMAAPVSLLANTMAAVRAAERQQTAPSRWQPVTALAIMLFAVFGIGAALISGGESLLGTLGDAVDDPASLLENLAALGMSSGLPLVLGTSALLLAGTAAFAQLMRSEFTTRTAS